MSKSSCPILDAVNRKTNDVLKKVADYFKRNKNLPLKLKAVKRRLRIIDALGWELESLLDEYIEIDTKWDDAVGNHAAEYGDNFVLFSLDDHVEKIDDFYDAMLRLDDEEARLFEVLRKLTNNSEFGRPSIRNEPKKVKIELADTFSGNPLEYCKFIKKFEREVGSKYNISDLGKLLKLKERLTGDALKTVEACSKDEYAKALELLEKKYGTKEIIGNEIMAQLHAPFRDKDSMKEVRRMFKKFEFLLSCLEDIGEPSDGFYLRWILKKNLPPVFVEYIDEKKKLWPENDYTLSDIIEELDCIVATFESINEEIDMNAEKKATVSATKKKEVSKEQPKKIKKPRCAFCHRLHDSIECRNYPTMDERKKVVSERDLCHNCLKPRHRAVDCTARPYCMKCDENHQPVWCEKERKSTEVAELNKKEFMLTKRNLMLTAKVNFINPRNPKLKKEGLLIIASASQVNLISERFAKELKLPGRKNFVDITGIHESAMKSYSEYDFVMELQDGSLVQYRAHGIKNLLFPIDVPMEREKMLRNERDFFENPVKLCKEQPVLLMGYEGYINHACREWKEQKNGFILQSSDFGPILGGEGSALAMDKKEFYIIIGPLRAEKMRKNRHK